jgi:O-antigen/teichoic acid export membrane protein
VVADAAGIAADPLDAPGAGAAAARGGALRGAAWIGGAVLSLVSIPLLVRHLGVVDFGRYVAVLTAINVAALASDLGLAGLALREWSAADEAERPRIMRTLLGMRLAVASVGAVVAIGFAAAANWNGPMVAGTAIAIVGLYAQVFGDFALVGLAGRLRFGRVAAVELTRSALGTLGVVILVIAGAGLVPFFAAYAAAALIAAALALRLAGGDVPLVPRFTAWRPLLGDTLAYAAASAIYVVYFRVIMLVVSLDASAHDTGLFATAYRVIEFAAAVAAVLAGTATPVLARAAARDPERLRRQAILTALATTAAGAFGTLILLVAAGPIMDLIVGDKADGAATVQRILAPTVRTTFAAFGISASLLVMRRYRELLTVNVIALAIALGAAIALVPAEGARGGAVAVVIGEVFMALAQGVLLFRALRGTGYHRPSGK